MITGSHHQQIYWYATGQHRLLGQLPGAYLIDEQRWIPRRMAVLHPPGDPVFSETGHWNSVCIACHTTHGKPRSSTPLGSEPVASQVVRLDHGGARHRLRVVSRAGRDARRRQSQPAAPLWAAPDRAVPTRRSCNRPGWIRRSRRRCAASATASGSSTTARRERRAQHGGPAVPARRRARGHEVRRAADARTEIRRRCRRSSPRTPGSCAIRSGPTARCACRAANTTASSSRPCFVKATDPARTLSCSSCHTLHQKPDDPRPRAEWAVDQLGADGQRTTRARSAIRRSRPT